MRQQGGAFSFLLRLPTLAAAACWGISWDAAAVFFVFFYRNLSRFPPPESPFSSFIQSDVTALKRVMVIAKVTACGLHERRRCRLATRGGVRGQR